MKYKTKANEKGITLVALIITIIILVILAAVSINAVYESRIVDYATNGATGYAEESIRENEIINSTESLLESTIAKISEITGGNGLSIGAYVKYSPDSASSSFTAEATYTGNDSTQTLNTEELQWRILSVDDDTITLISATPTSGTLTLKGANGYNNAVLLLNNACEELYSNSSLDATARSLNIEDIEAVAPGYISNGIERTYNSDTLTLNYPSIFAQEESQKVDSETAGTLGQSDQQGEYITEGALQANSYITATNTYYSYTISDTYMSDVYVELFASNSYWLASRCVNLDTDSIAFRVRYVDSNNLSTYTLFRLAGGEYSNSYALRPVVEINLSSVSIGASGDGSSGDPYTITANNS